MDAHQQGDPLRPPSCSGPVILSPFLQTPRQLVVTCRCPHYSLRNAEPPPHVELYPQQRVLSSRCLMDGVSVDSVLRPASFRSAQGAGRGSGRLMSLGLAGSR